MKLEDYLLPSDRKVCILGHVHPDGDCLGSQTAVYRYLTENFPEMKVVLYTKEVIPSLSFLVSEIPFKEGDGAGEYFDLAISVDASVKDRIPAGLAAFDEAKRTLCIDHHVTNPGFADTNLIFGEASSTAEVLYGLFITEKISQKTAVSLYTGIVHDTGVFRYSSTTPETLRTAAGLVEKGVPFSEIIEDSFVNMPYCQLKILGEVMATSVLIPEEGFLYGTAPQSLQKKYGVTPRDLGGIVSHLNETAEASVVLFLYENEDGTWKGSLRSRSAVDVSLISGAFNGGGHCKAAGFSFKGNPDEAVLKVRELIKQQNERNFIAE